MVASLWSAPLLQRFDNGLDLFLRGIWALHEVLPASSSGGFSADHRGVQVEYKESPARNGLPVGMFRHNPVNKLVGKRNYGRLRAPGFIHVDVRLVSMNRRKSSGERGKSFKNSLVWDRPHAPSCHPPLRAFQEWLPAIRSSPRFVFKDEGESDNVNVPEIHHHFPASRAPGGSGRRNPPRRDR